MSSVPVYKMKWTWLPDVREVNGLTVAVFRSDEPPSPELVVAIVGTPGGVDEITRCDAFAPGAEAKMLQLAELVADTLEAAEMAWVGLGAAP